MSINTDFLWVFLMPVLAVGLSLLIYAGLVLVTELVGWALGK